MPGNHNEKLTVQGVSKCKIDDVVKHLPDGPIGKVTKIQTVADGPNGVCTSTEVTVTWENGNMNRLNPRAPPSHEDSPSNVVYWKP